jgi:predicted lipid-binding transport protein (Tim44 family)
LLVLVLLSASLLVPLVADARAGSSRSFGSRGARTYQAPRPTTVAPATKPIERSATPQAAAPKAAQPAAGMPAAAPAPAGGFFARNPFMSGLMGGVLGAGLMGMMFGGGFSGAGLGGLGGMGSMLIQMLLIGGLVFVAMRLFRSRSAAGAPKINTDFGFASRPQSVPSMDYTAAAPVSAGPAPALLSGGVAEQPLITDADYKAFEALLIDVQAAYSAGDMAKLRMMASPEILGYFSEALSANVSRGVVNTVDAVKLEQGDLSEAWSEADLDYASVAMRFSLLDVTRNMDGKIVEGSDQVRSEATEVWTFLRSRGGRWIVSAIQQA